MNEAAHPNRPSSPASSARRSPRSARTLLAASGAAAVLAAALTGCGGDSLEKEGGGSADGGSKGELVVGSAGFTESQIMAELYSKLLAEEGYSTSISKLKNRELYEPALEKGEIDVVPEYAATLAEFLNAKKKGPDAKPVASNDVDETVAALEKLAERDVPGHAGGGHRQGRRVRLRARTRGGRTRRTCGCGTRRPREHGLCR